MRRIEGLCDWTHDRVTYELANGDCISLDGRLVREHGVAAILRGTEYEKYLPTERLSVYQWGRVIGTVPPGFDPDFIRSTSFFYEPRRGDFVREGDGWKAANNLGPGDLEAIPGFVWERPTAEPPAASE